MKNSWKSTELISIFSFIHTGYETDAAHLIDDDELVCPTLMEHDFNRFHHTMPGLRRTGVDANAIRQVNELDPLSGRIILAWKFTIFLLFFLPQHYYPDGGKHYENEKKSFHEANYSFCKSWSETNGKLQFSPMLNRLGLDCLQYRVPCAHPYHRIPAFLWISLFVCCQAFRQWCCTGNEWVKRTNLSFLVLSREHEKNFSSPNFSSPFLWVISLFFCEPFDGEGSRHVLRGFINRTGKLGSKRCVQLE